VLPNSIRTVRKDHKGKTVLYVLQDEVPQSFKEDPKVRGYYRPSLNPWTVVSSVFVTFVIFPYCDLRSKSGKSLGSRLLTFSGGATSLWLMAASDEKAAVLK
jgi:hypothetical protein